MEIDYNHYLTNILPTRQNELNLLTLLLLFVCLKRRSPLQLVTMKFLLSWSDVPHSDLLDTIRYNTVT